MAHANPRPLPFTYQSETLPAGAVEVEQFVDLVPVRAVSPSAEPVWLLTSQFQTEFEVGLTDKLELGLYISLVPQYGDSFNQTPVMQNGNGFKQRLRYRLADAGAWPIDVALYGEVTESDREIELEGKIILQRRIGRVRVITNLWAERELYFDGRREWVLNPTLGATAELSPRYHVGAEGWLRSEYPDSGGSPRVFNLGPHVYVGPVSCQLRPSGRLWRGVSRASMLACHRHRSSDHSRQRLRQALGPHDRRPFALGIGDRVPDVACGVLCPASNEVRDEDVRVGRALGPRAR